jgi:hypothetical protein
MNTYWMHHPRGFQNEYVIAIATTKAWADYFKEEGYARITRPYAIRKMSYKGDAATQTYIRILYDSHDADRFELATALRMGRPVDGAVLWDNGGGLCQ